ncbi:MAG: hypothetical protein RL301_237 [Actinomycetota bacterium]|jgi:drug/metabolite transporter (DMT)-like permease
MSNQQLSLPKRSDLFRLSLGVIGIGTSGPLIALSAMPIMTLIFWRNLGGAIFTFFLAIRHKQFANRHGLKWSAIAGVILAAHFTGFFISMRLTSVAAGTAITALQPIFAAIFVAMNGVRVSKKAWLGMAISFIGVLVITGVDLNISTKSFFGDLAALIGGALAALYVMAGAKAQREVESTTYMAICYFICAISALPIALLISPNIFQFEARQWLILLGLILGAQLLGHSMFNSVLKRVSPAVVSLIVFFEVPVAALLATWWLDQKPAGGIWLGIILILIGCALVILRNDEN